MSAPTCPKHDVPLVDGWHGSECPTCERERAVAAGCRCEGSGKCPECNAARAAGTAEKCAPSCSDLCPICHPDD